MIRKQNYEIYLLQATFCLFTNESLRMYAGQIKIYATQGE